MENKYIKANYNFVKMLTAAELVKLSKTYKDNLEEIVVLMERKKKTPQQPPQWFVQWNKGVFQQVIDNQEKDHKLLLRVIKLNNLKR